MTWQDRITLDLDILAGKPAVRGMRLAVDFVIERLGENWADADILRNDPGVTHDDIVACLRYASEAISHPAYPSSTGNA